MSNRQYRQPRFDDAAEQRAIEVRQEDATVIERSGAERLLNLPVHLDYFTGDLRRQYIVLVDALMMEYGVGSERRHVYGIYIEAIAMATVYARWRMDAKTPQSWFTPKELADVLGAIRKLGEQMQQHTEATFVRVGTEDMKKVVETILQIVADEVSDSSLQKRIFNRVRTFIQGGRGA